MENRREVFSKGLSPLYLPKYEILCENLGVAWQPYYGFRSTKEQDALYAEGRTAPGHVVTDARGGESPHNYGCGTDWTIWTPEGKPVWMQPKDPRWAEYIDAIKKAGLFWGGDFKGHFQDIDHNELKISVSWTRIYEIMKKEGLASAVAEIEQVMV